MIEPVFCNPVVISFTAEKREIKGGMRIIY